jgi:hypothetical protein
MESILMRQRNPSMDRLPQPISQQQLPSIIKIGNILSSMDHQQRYRPTLDIERRSQVSKRHHQKLDSIILLG